MSDWRKGNMTSEMQAKRGCERWGLLACMAAKLAAYNPGTAINRLCQRPDLAFADLDRLDAGAYDTACSAHTIKVARPGRDG